MVWPIFLMSTAQEGSNSVQILKTLNGAYITISINKRTENYFSRKVKLRLLEFSPSGNVCVCTICTYLLSIKNLLAVQHYTANFQNYATHSTTGSSCHLSRSSLPQADSSQIYLLRPLSYLPSFKGTMSRDQEGDRRGIQENVCMRRITYDGLSETFRILITVMLFRGSVLQKCCLLHLRCWSISLVQTSLELIHQPMASATEETVFTLYPGDKNPAGLKRTHKMLFCILYC